MRLSLRRGPSDKNCVDAFPFMMRKRDLGVKIPAVTLALFVIRTGTVAKMGSDVIA
jgi:hypothetical protein